MSNQFKCFLGILLSLCLAAPVFAGGMAEDDGDVERELARTQNELDRQKTRADDLEGRLNDLNNKVTDLESRDYSSSEPARSMSLLDEDFPIHGYITTSLADSDLAGADSTFDQEEFVLLYDYDLDENWAVHGDVALLEGAEIYVDGSLVDGVGDLVVQEAFVDWSPDFGEEQDLNVLIGKFYTPFGVWTPEEIAPTTHSVFDPILDRWAMHSEFTTGIQVNGQCELGDVTVDKALYVGNGAGFRPHSLDGNNDKVLGGLIRGTIPFSEEGNAFSLGISGQIGRESFSERDFQQKIYGLDARVDVADFTLRGETSRARTNAFDRHFWMEAWYVMGSYHFLEKYDVFYRYDEGDTATDVDNAGDIEVNSVGLAFRPIEPVVLKVQWEGYEDKDQTTEDYDVVAGQVSAMF